MTKKAAGAVLTAKQAPHRPGIAPALGLRAGDDRRPHSNADRASRGDSPMSRTSWLERSRARRPRRKAASPLRLEVLEDRNLLSFSSIASYAAGSQPQAVALGDFNNDTRLDLAVVNYIDNSVSVLLAKPDGTSGPALNAVAGAGPLSLAVGDFNGDSKLDIANVNGSDISVLLGNGDGTMQAAQSLALPGEFPPGYTGTTALPQQPISVAVGDFNAD